MSGRGLPAPPASTRAPAPSVLALGVAFSWLAGLVVTLRVASSGAHLPTTWLALQGSVSLLVVPSGFWLRRALEQRLPATDRALACGAALVSLPLALFASVLKSTTHHRPLGGATFAVVALGLLAFSLGVSFRIFRGGSHGPVKSSWQNAFTLGCGLSLGGALLLGFGRSTRPNLLELALLAAATVGVGALRVPRWLERVPLAAALAVWAALLTGALVSLREPELVRALTTRAPVAFAALSWLGGSF